MQAMCAEELVAEIGAAFLCCDLGITLEAREDHAAYVEHWLKVLKEDKRFTFPPPPMPSAPPTFCMACRPPRLKPWQHRRPAK